MTANVPDTDGVDGIIRRDNRLLNQPSRYSRPESTKPRVGVLASHPIQYQAPLFRTLTERGKVDLDVAFLSNAGARASRESDTGFGIDIRWDIDLLSGYQHSFLGSGRHPSAEPAAAARLMSWIRTRDLIVIYGQCSPWVLIASTTARINGVPYMLRSVATPVGRSGGWRRTIRSRATSIVVRSAAAGLTIGFHNGRFYDVFGAPRQFFAPYSVDNERFSEGAEVARSSRSEALSALGLPSDRPVVVLAAKLQEWKRPLDVVEAVRVLQDEVSLLIVGEGPLRGEVEAECADLPAVCVGFINQTELPHYYGLADILVLPSSREPWGLVVNEGMAAGLFPVVSDAVGCAPDLVEGVGEIFSTGHVPQLVSCLRNAVAAVGDPECRRRVTERIDKYSITATAQGFELAVREILDRREEASGLNLVAGRGCQEVSG